MGFPSPCGGELKYRTSLFDGEVFSFRPRAGVS